MLGKCFLTCSGHRLKFWQLVKWIDALNQCCQLLARFCLCVMQNSKGVDSSAGMAAVA